MKNVNNFDVRYKIQMKINDDKKIFYNGDIINGTITIKTDKIFSSIMLYILKQEKCLIDSKMLEKDSKINTKIYEVTESKNNILFDIKIPNDISPSFEFVTDKYQLYIKYYLFVEYKDLNFTSKNYISIFIKKIIKTNSELSLRFESDISRLIFSQGNCIGTINLLKTNIKMGGMINFNIEIDNKSNFDVKNLKISLIREININKDGMKKENYLLSKCIIKWIIQKHSKNSCNFSLKIQDNELNNINLEKWDSNFKNDMNYDQFFCSVSSELFECNYFLKITIYFSSFVKYNSRPRIIIPFKVCHEISEDLEEENKNNLMDYDTINITGIESLDMKNN